VKRRMGFFISARGCVHAAQCYHARS